MFVLDNALYMGDRLSKKGFTLIEIVVAVAVFAIVAVGIFSGIQFVFKVVYNSRVRIIETAVLNEQIEIIRNMSFFDVGIVNGSPAGLLKRSVTSTRDGISFIITRTVRNIDDPFDGLISAGQEEGGGECQQPKVEVCHQDNTLCVSTNALQGHLNHGDTAGACTGPGTEFDNQPADYKIIQVDVLCTSCTQRQSVSMTTFLAPKFLEGDPTHGALFVEVFDANAEPVVGADVHIVSVSTDPTYDFVDTTDNEGFVRVVDLAEGVEAYSITVSKDGYTSAETITSSPENPNPTKSPATVVAQGLTEISFSIDREAVLEIRTLNAQCTDVSATGITLSGTKVIGTSPDVLKVNELFTTTAGTPTTIDGLDWDSYLFTASNFDILGTIPAMPMSVAPGVTIPVQILKGADTVNSLLITVFDSVTGQAISNATITVTSTGGYSETIDTGISYTRQTDWSGGSGQLIMVDETQYWSDDGKLDAMGSPGDIRLGLLGDDYFSNGQLESSVFDIGTSANFLSLLFEPLAQPPPTGQDSVTFQIATSASSDPLIWNYLGPDGSASSYYTASVPAIADVHDGDQYLRYKVFLSTESATSTPTLSDVVITETTSCTPPGQAYLGGLSTKEYTIDISSALYQPTSAVINVSGNTHLNISLSPQ